MAPASKEFSEPGVASYDSNKMVVGDGTWDFHKNTFLMPNLQGMPFDTMRYNGMGNRFATLKQYHSLVLAHAVVGAIIFLLLIPFSVMTARFYANRPGFAVKYHAQVNILAGILLLAVFLLGYFAVGPERSLTNPHHGIGVAIFTLFIIQLVGGRLVKKIAKARSLRITLHQWFGRAIALLGIVQVPLGLTLYGSPKYLFILYTLWMTFLLVFYFCLSYRAEGRREFYMGGGGGGGRSDYRSEATRTRVTESEYFQSDRREEEHHSGKLKWLGPLAAGAGLFALARGRNKDKGRDRSRSRSRSRSPSTYLSRGPAPTHSRMDSRRDSRHDSDTYLTSEKYSELAPPKKSGGGGGFMKVLGGAAAAIGAGKLVSSFMNRNERRHEEEYSAVSTETPRRHQSGRRTHTMTDFSSELTPSDIRREPEMTRTSLIPPSGTQPPMAAGGRSTGGRSEIDSYIDSEPPVTPKTTPRPPRARPMRRRSFEESDYSSYVSPSRRPIDEPRGGGGGGGFAKGILGGLGMGWFAKKMADRRAQRDEANRLRDEEDLRTGSSVSRFTGDGHPSPTRRASRRPAPVRRGTGYPRTGSVLSSEMTESAVESRPPRGNYVPPTEVSTVPSEPVAPIPPPVPVPVPVPAPTGHASRSQSSHNIEPVSMPPMPPDPQGIFAGVSEQSLRPPWDSSRPSRRDRPGTAGEEDPVRYASPSSQPVSLKLKVHDDRDRNVTLRRLTEEEAMKARGRRDSESSISGQDSPSYGRRRYRRETSRRRTEAAAERKAEDEGEDLMPPLSPPNPAFAKAKGRRGKDSAYYSGQAGPSGAAPQAGQTVSSLGSLASPESHATWSGMSTSPPGPRNEPPGSAAADNRRRRRQERRRASESSRPAAADMFD